MCTEPSPDAAISVVDKYLTNIKGGNAKVNAEMGVQAELNRQIITMTDRSQHIVLLRDFLFRVCENSLNPDVMPQDTEKLYAMAFQITKTITESDARAGAPQEPAP